MSIKQYAERDAIALEKAGGYYSRHVSAMTTEGLHSKSDIAAELAWRDMRIAELERKIEDAFREGYWARSTYNDMEASDEDEEWAKFAKSNGIKEQP